MPRRHRVNVLRAHFCGGSPPGSFDIAPLGQDGPCPFGAEIRGFSIRDALRAGRGIGSGDVERLRHQVSRSRLLVFRGQTDGSDGGAGLSCEELVAFGRWFGAGRLHSSHRVHHRASHQDVFRVSNDPSEGCYEEGGVGTGGFHSDGHFLPNVYSHAVYQIVSVPASGEGHTLFADYGRAVARLAAESPGELGRLRRLWCYSSMSGVIHPLVHRHPVTGAEVLLIGAIGGAVEVCRGTADELLAAGVAGGVPASLDNEEPKTPASWMPLQELRSAAAPDAAVVAAKALDKEEVSSLLARLQRLLSAEGMHYRHRWRAGDVIVTDNLAVAHKAAMEAGDLSYGLRVLHRVTVGGEHVIG